MTHFPKVRLRRLRSHANLRNLVKETYLGKEQLVLPLFVHHGRNVKNPIKSMPGHFQFSVDELAKEIETVVTLGLKHVLLFGIPSSKDDIGSGAYAENGIVQEAIRTIKQIAPEITIMTDVCFCEYTDHGHCGILHGHSPDNDQTLEGLSQIALSHAKAGADIIAPSGMMDGMVGAIRDVLDKGGYSHLPILSYSVKYASAMYGPFRDAAMGAPKFGDRHTHQMHIANRLEALRECDLDVAEGADMLMVKPAHTYLDILADVKRAYPTLPLGAYHTSGEFAMIKAAAQFGWINEKESALEVLTAIRRAGADFIITYFAKDAAIWLP